MDDKIEECDDIARRSVVESRTSMVAGTSPSSVVNKPSKEDQDRMAAAIALTALPERLTVLPSTSAPSSRGTAGMKNIHNGFQHIPVQSMPTQPDRRSMGRAIAKPRQVAEHTLGSSLVPDRASTAGNANTGKKGNRGKKLFNDKPKPSKTRTIAQYYQQSGDYPGSKFRLSEVGVDGYVKHNDLTANGVSIRKESPKHDREDPSVDSRSVKHDAIMQPSNSREREQYATVNASNARTVISLNVVTTASNMGHTLNVPAHVLPAPMTTLNRAVVHPSVTSISQSIGHRPKSHHILQSVLPNTTAVRSALVTFSGSGVTSTSNKSHSAATGIPPNNASDVTSVDISTLNLPTNTPVTVKQDLTTHDSHVKILPKPAKKIVSQASQSVGQSQSTPVIGSHQDQTEMSRLALSNIVDDKSNQQSIKQLLSVSALSYLQQSTGPVKFPNFSPVDLKQTVTRREVSVSFPASQITSSTKTLPLTIAEGPPTRSSLISLPVRSASGSLKTNGNKGIDDLFPLSNHNPLLPRVFHSFHPTKNDPELQPTDLSLKKPGSGVNKRQKTVDNKGHDQPQDLSLSKAQKTQLIGKTVPFSRPGAAKPTPGPSVPNTVERHLLAGKTTQSFQFTEASTAITIAPSSNESRTELIYTMSIASTPMPPLVRGIPIPVLQNLIAQQQLAGARASQTHHSRAQDTTVESLPAVIMSTGEYLQGSQTATSRPTKALNECHDPMVATSPIIKSKPVVAEVSVVVAKKQLKATSPARKPVKGDIPTGSSEGSTCTPSKEASTSDTMIGTSHTNRKRNEGGDMPFQSDIERNRLPPKKKKVPTATLR